MLADSHQQTTLDQVKTLLAGRPLDLLFLDGDHTYEGVKQDFQLYSPLVRSGGLVAFHDIVPVDQWEHCEVDKFWKEIKQSHESREFIDTTDLTFGGIGVLSMP